MDKAGCVLQFINYTANKIIFENNNTYVKDKTDLKLKFKHITKEDDKESGTYYITLEVKIYDKEEIDLKDCPFQLEISLTGLFKLIKFDGVEKEIKDKLINENTIAILFPYLRNLITSVTASANINPLILPPVNVIAMLENEKNKE